MPSYMTIRDRRLQGGVPARPNLAIVNTDENTGLASVFSKVNARAGQVGGKIGTLFILCHGYAGENTRAAVSADAGGMGLQLGREDILHDNVDRWRAIKNKVENIVVYSCAAADTEAGNEGTTADGRYLMGALAIYTNAHVYAADRIQWYVRYGNLPNGRYDFGAWEGQLWHFPPSGAPPSQVTRAPVELSEVFAGGA